MARILKARTTSISVDELLEHSAWYRNIGPAARAQARRDIIERAIASGALLGHYGETQHYWFGVLEGMLKLSVNAPDGRTVTLGSQSVGSWFGEGTLLRGHPRQLDITALRRCRVALLPFETFDWLRRTEPTFVEFLLLQVNERLHGCMSSFIAHRLLDSDRLVARALVGLTHPLPHPSGERCLLISQEELANLATVSRQRCNAALAKLRALGLVQLEYSTVTVVDLPRLQAFAE
jgi:CRP-like cAMP-binding protein